MFKYIKHQNIDFKKWDKCIEASVNGMIYALSWYLNIVSPRWDGIIAEEEAEYVAVFPVTYLKKFGIKILRGPNFCHQLGLFYTKGIEQESLKEVLQILLKNFKVIQGYPLNYLNTDSGFPPCLSYSAEPSYVLSLNKDYKSIFKKFSANRRLNIKNGENSIEINTTSNSIDEVIKMFHTHVSFKIKGGVDQSQYDLLRTLYNTMNDYRMAFIKSARNENLLQAAALFIKWRGQIIFFINSSSPEGRRSKSIELIINSVIKDFAGQNVLLDFEGSHVENVAEFYKRFGAERRQFYRIDKNDLPTLVKFLQKAKRKISLFLGL